VKSGGAKNLGMSRMLTIFIALSLLSPNIGVAKKFTDKLAAGEKAYELLQFPEARKIYQELLNEIPETLISQTPVRFSSLLGLALIDHAEGKDSSSNIIEALKIGSWRNLPEEKYPPSFVAVYKQLQDSRVVDEKGSVAITTDPPFANLRVQGFKVGQSPLTINYLPAGKYLVSASMTGYESASRAIEIKGSDQKIVSFGLSIPKREKVAKKELFKPTPISAREKKVLAKLPPPPKETNHWYESSWVWGGAAVVGGAFAVYYFSQKPNSGTVTINLP